MRARDAWIFFVLTSKTSLKLTPTSASLPCRSTTTYKTADQRRHTRVTTMAILTFLLCSPSCSAAPRDECGFCDFEIDCKKDICALRDARSCLITKVSSLISLGRSSNRVFLLATARKERDQWAFQTAVHSRRHKNSTRSVTHVAPVSLASPLYR